MLYLMNFLDLDFCKLCFLEFLMNMLMFSLEFLIFHDFENFFRKFEFKIFFFQPVATVPPFVTNTSLATATARCDAGRANAL